MSAAVRDRNTMVTVNHRTVGNQVDMTSTSIFQNLNIGMNISMVSLSYSKTRFPATKSNSGEAHLQKIVHKSVILRRPFLLSTYQNIFK
jgi:hypothetical protein